MSSCALLSVSGLCRLKRGDEMRLFGYCTAVLLPTTQCRKQSSTMKRPLAFSGSLREGRARTGSGGTRSFHAGNTLRSKESSFDLVDGDADITSFATTYHAPVMWRECVDSLMTCARGLEREDDTPLYIVDGTLGGGGHSEAILERLRAGDVLFGCDVDSAALETASKRLERFTQDDPSLPLFIPVQSNFCNLAKALPSVLHPTTQKPILPASEQCVDGILLDLGVSSHQIDTAERGFAFMKDGPLDMRMDGGMGSMTAADVCNEFEEGQLQQLLKVYGDEPRAKRIAHSIVEHRPLATTQDLRSAIAAVTPEFSRKSRRMGRTATLARVFQSLRISVNQEDAVLEKALMEMCPALVRPGGRLVILSYHSMEDRFAKRVIRDGSVKPVSSSEDDRDVYGNYVGIPKPWKSVIKRRKATEDEVTENSRARSATLRVAERMET